MDTLLKRLIALLTFSFLVACTPAYIGKSVEGAALSRIDESGHISGFVGDVYLNYDVSINEIENTINIDGTIELHSDEFTGAWDYSKIIIHFYLLDETKTIIDRESIYAYPKLSNVDDKVSFSGIFDLKPEYKYVFNGYKILVSF